MKAVFELKEISQDWNPPFKKNVKSNEITVGEGDSFGDGKEGKIFKLIKINKDKALVQFSEKYTLKGHEHPTGRQVWIDKNEPQSFSALWEQNGKTAQIKLKSILS